MGAFDLRVRQAGSAETTDFTLQPLGRSHVTSPAVDRVHKIEHSHKRFSILVLRERIGSASFSKQPATWKRQRERNFNFTTCRKLHVLLRFHGCGLFAKPPPSSAKPRAFCCSAWRAWTRRARGWT